MNKEKTPTGECLKGPYLPGQTPTTVKCPVASVAIYRQPYELSTDGDFPITGRPSNHAPWATHRLPLQRSLRARAGRVVSRAHRFSDSPCWQVVPPGRACIAVHAPDAHCWYFVPMQLNMPSDVQGPDLAEEEEPPSEPVELPEPEPPPVGERVADGAGLVVAEAEADVSAEVDAGAEEEAESVAAGGAAEAESVAVGADMEAESESEVEDGFGAVVTGLT